ncbi:MAG: UvrB/UvrC motif-containing protein [Candidatus Omnitrophica bacterium]|nr:UvrB/UvrC motif-containing protein [Candidatus Omnitrophota bacterium]
MQCDVCKRKKATVHLTEIINDEVTELNLCEECAKSKGPDMHQHFSISDLLSGLVDIPLEPTQKKQHIRIKCPECGMSYSDFKRLGRFGCARCYEVFRRALYPLLKRIHGTARHVGKQPDASPMKKPLTPSVKSGPAPRVDELKELKDRLVKAIEHEEFEEAAVLRDRIKAIELKGSKI